MLRAKQESGRCQAFSGVDHHSALARPLNRYKWEYPWYAAWDLAFHTTTFAYVDPSFAKQQLSLMLSSQYLHPNGQIPAYEWNFGDVNPPVHAWATYSVYLIDQMVHGKSDHQWLKQIFHKLLINFTWWLNRKDIDGNNVFQGWLTDTSQS